MMELEKLIKKKIKEKKVIIGYDKMMKLIKVSSLEMIVFANDFPEEKRKIAEHNAKLSRIKVEEYPGDCVNLGLLCGKPFPVGVIAIKRSSK